MHEKLVLLLLTWLVACSTPEPQTQLLVWLRANAELSGSLAQVRVSVYPGAERADGGEPPGASFEITSGNPKAGEHTLPLSFVVMPGESERVEVVARGFATRDEAAEPIAEQRTSAMFEPGVTLELNMTLRALERECGAGCAEPAPDDPQPMAADSGAASETEADAGPDELGCAVPLGGEVCDPVHQCGCIAPAHCQLTDNGASCATAGKGASGDVCRLNRDCGSGLSCAWGACRNICRSDGDCRDAGAETAQCVRRKTGAELGFCAEPCAKPGAPSCREGLLCSPVEVGALQDSFCLSLEDPCATRGDSVCDEPGPAGSGFCATGSDPEDCCARKHGFDSCDPLTNCGCASGTACRVNGRLDMLASTACGAEGDRPIGARCEKDSQCVVGADCGSGICSRLCNLGGDEGQCQENEWCAKFSFTGVSVTDVGYCWIRCTKETAQQDCGEGTVCAQLFTGMFCFVQKSPCPPDQLNNGICDETITNICAPGTDTDSDCGR